MDRKEEMALRIVYPAWQCSRYRSLYPFEDDGAEAIFFHPQLRRKINPFRELENFLNGSCLALSSDAKKNEDKSSDSDDKKIFKYDFNLKGFQPNDVKVKTIGQKLVVEAENEEKSDKDEFESYTRRRYHQSIVLPNDVRPDDVTSSLNENGVLRISAPFLSLPAPEEEEKEVVVRREDKAESSSTTNNDVISDKKNENEADAADNEDKNDN